MQYKKKLMNVSECTLNSSYCKKPENYGTSDILDLKDNLIKKNNKKTDN